MAPADATPSTPEPKSWKASSTTLCEILPGTGTASVDEVLDLLDLASGRTAYRHAVAPVVTASFEQLTLHSPVPRGALLRVTARIIATGRTSLLLRVEAEAEDITTRTFRALASAYATFVCVGGASGGVVAPLSDGDAAGTGAKAALSAARRRYARPPKVSAPPPKAGAIPAHQLSLTVPKQYLPRHKNFAGQVFGGDLLETTTRVATYAAARLAPHATARCVGIRYYMFVQPISPLDLWHLTARVAAVKRCVAYVEVRATIDSKYDGKLSHDALYAVALMGGVDVPQVDFTGADEDTMQAHARAVLWMEEQRINVADILA